MNRKIKINLNMITDGKEFVQNCSKYEEDINVYSERLVIDAKSILGVMSLDLSKDIFVEILTTDQETGEKFYAEVEKFEVK